MNTIDFSHRGGFPLETDTLIFLQTKAKIKNGKNYAMAKAIKLKTRLTTIHQNKSMTEIIIDSTVRTISHS